MSRETHETLSAEINANEILSHVEDGTLDTWLKGWHGAFDNVTKEGVGTCGEWRENDWSYGLDDTWELWCTPCDVVLDEGWNYCPNCGRKVVDDRER